MNKELRKKIEKHFGWDFCEHGYIRRFCPECKYDVPAFWRKEDERFYQVKKQLELFHETR
jgi:hypothetical protein